MRHFKDHLIFNGSLIKHGLQQLNDLALDAILFVVDENDRLIGSLTDGDVRRGLIKGLSVESKVEEFLQPNPKFIRKGEYKLQEIVELKKRGFRILPVLNKKEEVINVINFRFLKSYLPIDAIIMAGGRGSRLRPLTDTIPKPLLMIGDKPIIEHNIDRLIKFGVDDFHISLRYLGEQVEAYFGNGKSRGVSIDYVWEKEPLGTIGAVTQIDKFHHDHVLVTNSDVLTTLDYEDFLLDFMENDADFAVATIPYPVDIPYAVLETEGNLITSFKEKPTYIYYSNAGIYLMKKEVLQRIPKNSFYNSTDLMEDLIKSGSKVLSYPMRNYWLDIGKHEDFERAQQDVKHLNWS